MHNNKITESWTSIGTILGQPVIDRYTFYLKKYNQKVISVEFLDLEMKKLEFKNNNL